MKIVLDVNSTEKIGKLTEIAFDKDTVIMISPSGIYMDTQDGINTDNDRRQQNKTDEHFWNGIYNNYPLCCILWFIYEQRAWLAAEMNGPRLLTRALKKPRALCPECLIKTMRRYNDSMPISL